MIHIVFAISYLVLNFVQIIVQWVGSSDRTNFCEEFFKFCRFAYSPPLSITKILSASWWRVSTSVLLGRTLVSPWWRRWLRLCGGSPATPWWWSGDAGRLFTAVMMRVKTHPFLGRRRWRHWRHFLSEGDVEHFWLGPCSYLWTVSWASVSHVGCGR